MTNHRLVFLIVLFTACAASDDEPSFDGGVKPVPIDPAGTFAIQSSIALAAPPAAVAAVLAELTEATDGPDDPSRYLIEIVIDRLPPGVIKTYATELGPFVAAYVNDRIMRAAPQFVPGVRALVAGLSALARRISTIEYVEIAAGGRMTRTIEGLRFDGVEIYFADVGHSDVTAVTTAVLAGEGLVIGAHAAALAYGPLVRLGLDRSVIPAVVLGASDLAEALHGLVDCHQLGMLIAEGVGLGSAAFYADACTVGLTAAAARIYGHLPAVDAMPIALEVAGTARAIDRDGDGAMDAIEQGRWVGTFDGAPIGVATFAGTGR